MLGAKAPTIYLSTETRKASLSTWISLPSDVSAGVVEDGPAAWVCASELMTAPTLLVTAAPVTAAPMASRLRFRNSRRFADESAAETIGVSEQSQCFDLFIKLPRNIRNNDAHNYAFLVIYRLFIARDRIGERTRQAPSYIGKT